jgi:cell division protein FtsZ
MAEILPEVETFARIKVVGVGGGGGAAVERMIAAGVKGIEFIAINTDAQALHYSHATRKVHIGQQTTRGLGAGADPEVGRRAAEESEKEIAEILKGSDMVFITLGAGGGTGTGAAPLIAQIAKQGGALVVAMATKPFAFEGERRSRVAEAGIAEIKDNVDTLITIPNDRLLQTIDRKTSLLDAFGVVDEVLRQGVQGISDLITIHGLINLDFADVKAIMSSAGSALMGIGRASGENRAIEAARQAIDSPLLELNIEGAKGVLFNITGGRNMSMHEIDEAAKTITGAVDEDANIIFGAVLDESLDDDIKITVVATGFEQNEANVRETFSFQAPAAEPADEYVDALYGAPSYTERKPFIDEAPRRFEPTPEEDVPSIEPEEEPVDELFEDEAPRRKPEADKPFVHKPDRTSMPGDDDDDLDIPTFMRHKID